jgi:hypothetical protein
MMKKRNVEEATMKRLIVSFGLIALSLTFTAPALAYWEDQDEYTLEMKGFSPELIQPASIIIDRMEGRYQAPKPNKAKQFFYNMMNNEWAGSLDRFSQDGIDPPLLPFGNLNKHL